MQRISTAVSTPSRLGPGLVLVVVGTVAALALHALTASLSALVVAVVLGVIIGNSRLATPDTAAGLSFAARPILRAGVVLLGVRLSLGDVVALGPVSLGVVASTVAITFFGTQALGRRLGLSRDLSLLVATGYSICGASAIAAVEGATDAEEEEVAAALGLVAVAGTAAIFVLPWLNGSIGLSDASFGAWAGASIHDVGQVVAAAGATEAALSAAVVVKLTRVVLLAPIVAGVNLSRNRTKSDAADTPLLPLFVVGFLAAILVRSSGVLTPAAIGFATTVESVLLTAAMVGLGSAVRIDKLRRLGPAPLLLGLLAWILVGSVSLAGVLLSS